MKVEVVSVEVGQFLVQEKVERGAAPDVLKGVPLPQDWKSNMPSLE